MKGPEDLRNLPVTAKGGTSTIPLRNVAKVTPGTIIGQYDRYNMARHRLRHRQPPRQRSRQRRRRCGKSARPADRSSRHQSGPPGPDPTHDELQSSLRTGLLTAITAILRLLMANFQSVRLALIVITTLPAVLLGVCLALWLTHTTLNVQSFMGAIMSTGVAIANAILLVTFAHRAHRNGQNRNAAALTGAVSRLRPILMTSLAMMAGMLPMAFGGGQAGPLGKAVLGGLALGTLATLFILPASYALLAKSKATSASLGPDEEGVGKVISY